MCLKIAGCVANSVDPDETPRSAASHLGLYCLLRPVCPNTYGKYGNTTVNEIYDFISYMRPQNIGTVNVLLSCLSSKAEYMSRVSFMIIYSTKREVYTSPLINEQICLLMEIYFVPMK